MARKTYEVAFELAGKLNSSFERMFASADKRLNQTNRQISSIEREIKSLDKALYKGEIGVEEYAKSYEQLTENLRQAERAQKRYSRAVKAEQLADKTDRARGSMQTGLMGAAGAAFALAVPTRAAVQFESSMADVRKVVDFETPEQFQAMGQDIRNLSKRIPVAVDGLAQIVATGGQAGIAREELVKYAEDAAKMGVAYDVTADRAGKWMATWRTAFQMSQDEVRSLSDQINYLSNNTAVSAPRLAEITNRVGALGGLAGLTAGEVAALGSAMPHVSPEVASAGLKKLFTTLTAGEAATKPQREALAGLGFDVENLAKRMQTDAKGTLIDFIETIQKLPEEKQLSYFKEILGEEGMVALGPLIDNLDNVKQGFDMVGDSSNYAGSMQEEFEARSKTTGNKLQRLSNKARSLSITVGNQLSPTVGAIAEKLGTAAQKVESFAQKHPGLTKAVVVGTAALTGLMFTVAGLGLGFTLLISPIMRFVAWANEVELIAKLAAARTKAWTIAQKAWNLTMKVGRALLSPARIIAYRGAMLAASVATKAWTIAQRALNLAMRLNPIGLVITAITALVAAGYLLIKNWDKVKNSAGSLWETLSNAFKKGVNKAVGWINTLIEKVNKIPGVDIGTIDKLHVKNKSISPMAQKGVPGHAEGGIFNKPHLAWFAEKGTEAAIPLDGSAGAVSTWKEAGNRLGVNTGGNSININAPFSPVIHGESSSEVSSVLEAQRNEFVNQLKEMVKDVLSEIDHEGNRISYGW